MTSKFFLAAPVNSRWSVAGFRPQAPLLRAEKSHIEGDLIVATARRVELSSGGADLFRQATLDVHMDIFVGCREDKFAAFDFPLNGF